MEPFRFKHNSTGDKVAAIGLWALSLVVLWFFSWMMWGVVSGGWSVIDWSFLTSEPRDAGREGGIAPILVSTIWILAVCMVVAVPVALFCGIWLAEFNRQNPAFSRWLRHSLDILAGVPSIVFGLFGNAFFCIFLGMGYSIISGGLTLACMILPILIRSTEIGFAAVPDSYRYGALALGFGRFGLVWRVLFRQALPVILSGLVLGLGRAAAETAALIFTSGYVDRMPEGIWDSGRAISVHIYDLSMHVNGAEPQAYASACLLLILILIINLMRLFIGKWRLGLNRMASGAAP